MADLSKPFDSGHLKVDDIHSIYYEQHGRQDGKPVIFLHGGPGGQISPVNTVFFDLSIFRVVLFDQRGAGQSTPAAEIRANTTQLVVDDIETLRRHVHVEQWHIVFGGSWGSALALVYAQTHPEVVRSLVIRGVWTGRKAELQFSRGTTGAARLYPAEYARFVGHLRAEDRADPIAGYYRLMLSPDAEVRKKAAFEWNRWDLTITALYDPPNIYDKLEDERWIMAHAMLETYYFIHGAFLDEGQLLEEANVERIRHIPVSIVQGRYDICTAPQTAWDLHQLLPKSELHWVQATGHSANDPGVTEKLQEVVRNHVDV